MLDKFRERRNEEDGFTLVELLVVMLILGILAAIAIPAFFSQRDKGYDSDAKANARTVQTALETYAVENGGAYTDASLDALAEIEGTISNFESSGEDATGGSVTIDSAGADNYQITATSDSGNTFTITRGGTGEDATPGALSYTCETAGDAGCPSGGNWG